MEQGREDYCVEQELFNRTFTLGQEREEMDELFEYLGLTPSPTKTDPLPLSELDLDLPLQAPNNRRLTFTRYSENLPTNWNRDQRTPSPETSRSARRISYNELFDWIGEEDDVHATLFNSLRSVRRSMNNAEDKIRAYTKDYLMYNLTLTSAYIAFSLMFGILLAYLIHSFLHNHSKELQSGYDSLTPINSSAFINLTQLKQSRLGIHNDFAQMLEYQVSLQCSHYRNEWEAFSQCRLKNQEYLEKIHVMEDEISDLRQQSSEKLAQKQKILSKLIKAVKTFKEEHICIRISSIYQFLMFLWNCCWIATVTGYVAHRYNLHSFIVYVMRVCRFRTE